MTKTPPELLAPAGDFESVRAALYFGADAVYFSHKSFSLRSGADNFELEQLKEAIDYCHSLSKKAYITANIFAGNNDIDPLKDYFKTLEGFKPDALIISDPGVLQLAKKYSPSVDLHLSTQANTTNVEAANFWARQGIKRIILARELSLNDIKKIRDSLPNKIELEAFVHGAMCVAYSGRCLISAFLSNRSANRGECAQHCRFNYEVREKGRDGEYLQLSQDELGSYILNSKDLCLIEHLDKLQAAGISSFKIEGRNKTAYYVANVVNAYRRAIELLKTYLGDLYRGVPTFLINELTKCSHRAYFTGFYFNDKGNNAAQNSQYLPSSRADTLYQFVGVVKGSIGDILEIEQRNRFCIGDTLEVLSPGDALNKTFKVEYIQDAFGNNVEIANKVKQRLFIKVPFVLREGDMLRVKL